MSEEAPKLSVVDRLVMLIVECFHDLQEVPTNKEFTYTYNHPSKGELTSSAKMVIRHHPLVYQERISIPDSSIKILKRLTIRNKSSNNPKGMSLYEFGGALGNLFKEFDKDFSCVVADYEGGVWFTVQCLFKDVTGTPQYLVFQYNTKTA